MLRVCIVNDRTGTDDDASYTVVADVNSREIARVTVTGHRRSDPWWVLLRKIADAAQESEIHRSAMRWVARKDRTADD